jgi:L-cysteine S-thiosulfotransferase
MLRAIAWSVALLALSGPVSAQQAAKIDPAIVDRTIKETFKGASAEWQARIDPDEAQRVCSESRGNPPADIAQKLVDTAIATVVYPPDGKVLGDWKKGQRLAQRGTGGQFSDRPDTPKGANCYACHQLSPAELSFGTLGPSLAEYGKIRRFREADAKAAYAKIYNAQTVLPCSNMPRFGHNKFLTIEEIKDITAYLFDPESPVNK